MIHTSEYIHKNCTDMLTFTSRHWNSSDRPGGNGRTWRYGDPHAFRVPWRYSHIMQEVQQTPACRQTECVLGLLYLGVDFPKEAIGVSRRRVFGCPARRNWLLRLRRHGRSTVLVCRAWMEQELTETGSTTSLSKFRKTRRRGC